MGYAQAAIKCIVNTSSKQSYKATHHGLAVSGIHKRISQACRRRVSGWVMKKSQKGAWPQKLVLPAKAARACFRRFFAASTPSAALASQLGKFPKAKRQPATCASSPKRNISQPPVQVPQSETLAHQLGKFPRSPAQQPSESPLAAAICMYYEFNSCSRTTHGF